MSASIANGVPSATEAPSTPIAQNTVNMIKSPGIPRISVPVKLAESGIKSCPAAATPKPISIVVVLFVFLTKNGIQNVLAIPKIWHPLISDVKFSFPKTYFA